VSCGGGDYGWDDDESDYFGDGEGGDAASSPFGAQGNRIPVDLSSTSYSSAEEEEDEEAVRRLTRNYRQRLGMRSPPPSAPRKHCLDHLAAASLRPTHGRGPSRRRRHHCDSLCRPAARSVTRAGSLRIPAVEIQRTRIRDRGSSAPRP
jgi:hypothetical protein